eukprot:5361025-Prymnesium_polylepis.2
MPCTSHHPSSVLLSSRILLLRLRARESLYLSTRVTCPSTNVMNPLGDRPLGPALGALGLTALGLAALGPAPGALGLAAREVAALGPAPGTLGLAALGLVSGALGHARRLCLAEQDWDWVDRDPGGLYRNMTLAHGL